MYISTNKSYTNISLSEMKEGLRISIDDPTYDAEILSLIQAAVQISEAFTGCNIAYTVSDLEDYCVHGQYYCINEPNITLSAITTTNGDVSTGITATTYKNFNSTILKFPRSIQAEKLNIVYTSGFRTEIPAALKRALIIKIRELFDAGDQYLPDNMISTKAFERLLSPYIILSV
jgi:hypothetical protein